MVAVVNGYLCFSSCDAEKAKQGKDPNLPPGATEADSKDPTKPKSTFDDQPATLLDGALKDFLSSNAVNPAAPAKPPDETSRRKVDLLV